ncbi:MAG TPA: pyridoxal-phosphate dependent enzyme [Candidatus Thermoplasmatota archaeon]
MRAATTARLEIPTLMDVKDAAKKIRRYLPVTPFRSYPTLNETLGFDAFLKHEHHLPTGAFKVRGGVNLVSRLTKDERSRGIIGASTGNHGQSIAYAGKLFDVEATIAVPRSANPGKVEAMRALGADVVLEGANFDEARVWVAKHAERTGMRYIHSGNEPHLIAGVGTNTLEMLTAEPDLDAILVPVGGGSGAAGACIVAKGLKAKARVIGVQSASAPAAYRSWKERRLVTEPSKTFAEGLATGAGFELPQQILWQHLDDFQLVPDVEIAAAMRTLLQKTPNLVEAAGAASLAAASALRKELRGKKVGLVLSGGNISMPQLRELLA